MANIFAPTLRGPDQASIGRAAALIAQTRVETLGLLEQYVAGHSTISRDVAEQLDTIRERQNQALRLLLPDGLSLN